MALKSFCSETLHGNWYEERQAPLNGVLPNFNVKEFSTSSATSFTAPQRVVERKPQVGMLIREGLRNFQKDRVYEPSAFFESKQRAESMAFRDSTVHTDHYGPRIKARFAETRTTLGAQRSPAGGAKGSEDQPGPRKLTFGLTACHGDLQRINKVQIFQDD